MKEQMLTTQGPNPKINEYVERIKAGADKESVLQGLPQSWISAVEAKIGGTPEAAPQEELEAAPAVIPREEVPDPEIVAKQKEEKLTKEQEQIDSLREQLGVIQKTVKFEGLENMGPVLEKIGETHYLFTHQTEEGVAQDIFNSQFHVSPGTGISSTLTWLSSEGAINQIQRQMDGDSHRGHKGMFIAAVPKEILDMQGGKSKAEALENYLLENPLYGKDGNSDLVIPKEYNLRYLQGSTLKVGSNFAENQISQEIGPELKQIEDLGGKLRIIEDKYKEIKSTIESQWYKKGVLDNQSFTNMNQQIDKEQLYWAQYEFGTTPDDIQKSYQGLVDSLSQKYDTASLDELNQASYGISDGEQERLSKKIQVLKKYIESNGLKPKQEKNSNQPPVDYDTSWLKI